MVIKRFQVDCVLLLVYSENQPQTPQQSRRSFPVKVTAQQPTDVVRIIVQTQELFVQSDKEGRILAKFPQLAYKCLGALDAPR